MASGIIKGYRTSFLDEDLAKTQHKKYLEVTRVHGTLNERDIDAGMAFMRYLKTYCERGDAAMYDPYVRLNTNASHYTMTRKVQVGIRVVARFNSEINDCMRCYDAKIVHFGDMKPILLPDDGVNMKVHARMMDFLFAMIFKLPTAVIFGTKVSPRRKCEYACCYVENKYVPEMVKRDMSIDEFENLDKNAYILKKEWERSHIIIPKI